MIMLRCSVTKVKPFREGLRLRPPKAANLALHKAVFFSSKG